jgi:predicted RNase H-like HicB family nuclease
MEEYQDQNLYQIPYRSAPWFIRGGMTPQDAIAQGMVYQYFNIDVIRVVETIHRAEVAELREEIAEQRTEVAELRAQLKNLHERLEKVEQKLILQIIPIQFLESERLQLKQPIIVSLYYSEEGAGWIVDCPELNVYGEGEDEQQAIDDFKSALEEFYFSLKKDREKLGPELRNKWGILQKIVEEKPK